MAKICDHKCVGMMVWQNDKLLLIERRKGTLGFAPPAGHVEGNDSFEESAKRELEEEVGLDTKNIKFLIEGRKENPCRRENGTWHYWKIYRIEASGKVERSENETKQAGWYNKNQILALAKRTKTYLAGQIPEDEWSKNPGLEPVWFEWMKELKIWTNRDRGNGSLYKV